MKFRLSSIVSKRSNSSAPSHLEANLEKPEAVDDDAKSIVSTVVQNKILTPPRLTVKRVDWYFSSWSQTWKYRNTSSKATRSTQHHADDDPWKEFDFVIVRTIPNVPNQQVSMKVVVKTEYIRKACIDVIQEWPGISWHANPLELPTGMFITLQSKFKEYATSLQANKDRSQEENYVLSSVNLLNSTIASDFRDTFAEIRRLTSHGEITFDTLYAILVPKSIMVTRCAATGLPRLFELASWIPAVLYGGECCYQLSLQSIDLVDQPLTGNAAIGRTWATICIKQVHGVVKITSLEAYPLEFHPDPVVLKEQILARGKKWVSLIGVHHKQFNGVAGLREDGILTYKHNVRSRIIVDRATFRRVCPKYILPQPLQSNLNVLQGNCGFMGPRHSGPDGQHAVSTHWQGWSSTSNIPAALPPNNNNTEICLDDATPDVDITDEDLLLTPAAVIGFSLSEKLWLEFNVQQIEDVEWNKDAFDNLVLPSERKDLLQSLVEAHYKEVGFDDFIPGKGQGLIINLFGPPGVGKTLSAEATSEHLRRPLYVVGSDKLGTTASSVCEALTYTFDLAGAWKAIVLIDEADVFLEQRSMHDLERNAMVAVFLREVEYYRGILFLTTNRVEAFDEAFLSRIHVALNFEELTQESREKIWSAFIKKMSNTAENITKEQITDLAKRDINGRQIKNAAKTAQLLATAKGEKLTYEHLRATLNALDKFTKEFEKSRLKMRPN